MGVNSRSEDKSESTNSLANCVESPVANVELYTVTCTLLLLLLLVVLRKNYNKKGYL